MRILLSLLVALAFFGSFGAVAVDQPTEGSLITEATPGQFAYSYFNYRPEMLAFFESKELQGGGYTWEALSKAALELSHSPLAGAIEFDSEGDALVAYSTTRAALEQLESLVKRMAADLEFRNECLALAEKSGDLE